MGTEYSEKTFEAFCEDLEGYVEGTLPETRRREMDAFLESSEEARALLSEFQQANRWFEHVEWDVPEPKALPTAQGILDAAHQRTPGWQRWWQALVSWLPSPFSSPVFASVLALGMLVGVTWYVIKPNFEKRSTDSQMAQQRSAPTASPQSSVGAPQAELGRKSSEAMPQSAPPLRENRQAGGEVGGLAPPPSENKVAAPGAPVGDSTNQPAKEAAGITRTGNDGVFVDDSGVIRHSESPAKAAEPSAPQKPQGQSNIQGGNAGPGTFGGPRSKVPVNAANEENSKLKDKDLAAAPKPAPPALAAAPASDAKRRDEAASEKDDKAKKEDQRKFKAVPSDTVAEVVTTDSVAQSAGRGEGLSTAGKQTGGPRATKTEPTKQPNLLPLVARTVTLEVVATDLSSVRAQYVAITQQNRGTIVSSASGDETKLHYISRVPPAQLANYLAKLRSLGAVKKERTDEREVTRELDDQEQKNRTAENSKADEASRQQRYRLMKAQTEQVTVIFGARLAVPSK